MILRTLVAGSWVVLAAAGVLAGLALTRPTCVTVTPVQRDTFISPVDLSTAG